MSTLRKFIAGAVCPSCKQVDKLFVSTRDGIMVCECVACGFRDVRDPGAEPGTAEFGRGLGDTPADVGVVRIVDP
jgi:uncharacterized metal-binding protein (TIGR02443 family)